MKNPLIVLLALVSPVLAANLKLTIEPVFNGEPLRLDALLYANAAGETLSMTRPSDLLGGFAVERDDGQWIKLPDSTAWMDAGSRRNVFLLGNLPEGNYRALRLHVGPDATANAVDLFSTVLELAGVPLPASVTLDSRSLRSVLANQSTDVRVRIYNEQLTQSDPAAGGRAIRDDRYQFIRLNNGIEEFYDLQASPADTVSLLAKGLSPVDQSFYNRLRFNLGGFSPVATPPPSNHAVRPAGLFLTLPEKCFHSILSETP